MKNKAEFEISDFTVINDVVIVREVEETAISGLTAPKTVDAKPIFGTVVAVSKNIEDLSVGDTVIFGRYTTEELRHNGVTYFFVHYEDIRGYIKNEPN